MNRSIDRSSCAAILPGTTFSRVKYGKVLSIFLTCIFCFTAFALRASTKPMPPATAAEAMQSDWIVVARYLGHKPPPNQDLYFAGLDAEYQVESVLKKSSNEIVRELSLKRPIRVNYAFHDGSPCMSPSDFKLDESKLPPINSRWILFLTPTDTFNHFSTYRGDYGRWPATSANCAKVNEWLSSGRR